MHLKLNFYKHGMRIRNGNVRITTDALKELAAEVHLSVLRLVVPK